MRVLVGITGASGLEYARRLIEVLSDNKGVAITVVASSGVPKVADVEGLDAIKIDYDTFDFNCPYASGSNPPDAVIIVPCSLKTLGEIANGIGDNLITRASEVAFKERKKLILCIRDTPYSLTTIRNMEKVTLSGGIIMPASPGFYGKPASVDDLIDFIVARIMDQIGLDHDLSVRWGE